MQYRANTTFITSMVYFLSEEENIHYIGNINNENALEHVNIYKETVHTTVKKIDQSLQDEVKFLSYDNTLYMIRSLYSDTVISSEDLDPFAVMVMEVDSQQLLRGLKSIVWLSGATIKIDNVKVNLTGISIGVSNTAK
jgi:hypothetical protein